MTTNLIQVVDDILSVVDDILVLCSIQSVLCGGEERGEYFGFVVEQFLLPSDFADCFLLARVEFVGQGVEVCLVACLDCLLLFSQFAQASFQVCAVCVDDGEGLGCVSTCILDSGCC